MIIILLVLILLLSSISFSKFLINETLKSNFDSAINKRVKNRDDNIFLNDAEISDLIFYFNLAVILRLSRAFRLNLIDC